MSIEPKNVAEVNGCCVNLEDLYQELTLIVSSMNAPLSDEEAISSLQTWYDCFSDEIVDCRSAMDEWIHSVREMDQYVKPSRHSSQESHRTQDNIGLSSKASSRCSGKVSRIFSHASTSSTSSLRSKIADEKALLASLKAEAAYKEKQKEADEKVILAQRDVEKLKLETEIAKTEARLSAFHAEENLDHVPVDCGDEIDASTKCSDWINHAQDRLHHLRNNSWQPLASRQENLDLP